MSTAPRLPRGSRLALGLKALIAIYAFAAMALPLAHHDVVCHTKTPTHCVTCVIAASGDVAADPGALARLGLNDAGAVPVDGSARVVLPARLAPAGRAPPASA